MLMAIAALIAIGGVVAALKKQPAPAEYYGDTEVGCMQDAERTHQDIPCAALYGDHTLEDATLNAQLDARRDPDARNMGTGGSFHE